MTNLTELEVKYTSYDTGIIRDAVGKLVAHWDKDTKDLVIDGIHQIIRVNNIEHAMDFVCENFSKKVL